MDKARDREKVIVEIEADSELAKALADAGKNPVTIIRNGRRYVATRDPFDPVRDDDPEAFEKALRAVVGTLTPEEGERLKRTIYPWRDEEGRRIDSPHVEYRRSNQRLDDLWADYDPERVRAAEREAAGSLTDER